MLVRMRRATSGVAPSVLLRAMVGYRRGCGVRVVDAPRFHVLWRLWTTPAARRAGAPSYLCRCIPTPFAVHVHGRMHVPHAYAQCCALRGVCVPWPGSQHINRAVLCRAVLCHAVAYVCRYVAVADGMRVLCAVCCVLCAVCCAHGMEWHATRRACVVSRRMFWRWKRPPSCCPVFSRSLSCRS